MGVGEGEGEWTNTFMYTHSEGTREDVGEGGRTNTFIYTHIYTPFIFSFSAISTGLCLSTYYV